MSPDQSGVADRSAKDNFPRCGSHELDQIPGGQADPRVERQRTALRCCQPEAGPVIVQATFYPEDHRLALEILDDDFQVAVMEQIAYCQAPGSPGEPQAPALSRR